MSITPLTIILLQEFLLLRKNILSYGTVFFISPNEHLKQYIIYIFLLLLHRWEIL